MAYDLGKIAMHTRIFVRLANRTQVVPDDKSRRRADRRRRLEGLGGRSASAATPNYVDQATARELQQQRHPHDGRPLHLQRHPAQGDAVLQLRPDRPRARAA